MRDFILKIFASFYYFFISFTCFVTVSMTFYFKVRYQPRDSPCSLISCKCYILYMVPIYLNCIPIIISLYPLALKKFLPSWSSTFCFHLRLFSVFWIFVPNLSFPQKFYSFLVLFHCPPIYFQFLLSYLNFCSSIYFVSCYVSRYIFSL